jgi:hypothetical protein
MKFLAKFVPLVLAWGVFVNKISPLHAKPLEQGLRGRRRLAALHFSALNLSWETVVNNKFVIPGRDPSNNRTFNSYNPPSVNENGLVVLRARAMGGDMGQVSGIYTRDMADINPVIKQLDRDTDVPAPNNENAQFNEFPAFPRIAKISAKIATRGQHTPFFSFVGSAGNETVGTTGIFVNLAVDSGENVLTGASNIGDADPDSNFAIDGTK